MRIPDIDSMQESKIQYKPHDEWSMGKSPLFYAEGHKVEYAGFWLRVIASFIDSFALTFAFSVIFGFLFMFVAILLPTFVATLGEKLQNFSPHEDHIAYAIIVGVTTLYAVTLILNWLYFAIFEASSYQATPGKMALDLKVTGIDGKRISFLTASIRYWAKIPSALILCIGFFMAGWTEKKQCLHDIITDTLVIKK